ncbi:MAG: 16S rRNA (guanine(527)-N(7))-methyltransferase RsmG [Synechococcus sp.]|nr:16S rRNA (guanine(527)-N(7))-methyltransferase RsmG [Synechococcus sp.]
MAADPPGDPPATDLWMELGWQPTAEQLQQLQLLQELLRRWNQRLNLTRLVEGDDYWIAQVLDSLWPLLPWLQQSGAAPLRVIDVGTGGGFPGLAAAIALPAAQLTLVDSVGRKLEAVAAMAEELGLRQRLELRCERVERTGHQRDCRGRFDLALARAVAAAPVVAEYLVPLLAPHGKALLYRGQWTDTDQRTLERALKPLRARICHRLQRELPAGRGLRTLLALQPLGPCPAAYPRAVGLPAKQPLGLEAPP